MTITSATWIRFVTATAVLTVLTLVLAGCTDRGDLPNASTQDGDASHDSAFSYEFENLLVADPEEEAPYTINTQGEPLTIRLSDGIISSMPEDFAPIVESYTVTPRTFTTGICALDVSVNYTLDGLSALTGPLTESVYDNDTLKYSDEVSGLSEVAAAWLRLTGGSWEEGNLHTIVAALPSDDDLKDDAAYLLDDYSAMTFVGDCSKDMDDDFAQLKFVQSGDYAVNNAWGIPTAALVDVGVWSDGLLVLDGSVNADVSVAGAWVAPEHREWGPPTPTSTPEPDEVNYQDANIESVPLADNPAVSDGQYIFTSRVEFFYQTITIAGNDFTLEEEGCDYLAGMRETPLVATLTGTYDPATATITYDAGATVEFAATVAENRYVYGGELGFTKLDTDKGRERFESFKEWCNDPESW